VFSLGISYRNEDYLKAQLSVGMGDWICVLYLGLRWGLIEALGQVNSPGSLRIPT